MAKARAAKGALARKLGITSGQTIALIDAPPEIKRNLQADAPRDVRWVSSLLRGKVDQVFLWPSALAGFASRMRELQTRIVPDGSVWVVMPKKPFAPDRGIRFTWEEMQAEGLRSDLVDNKVASLSEQDYATRFVIRKALRLRR
jgi:hypothetical protein